MTAAILALDLLTDPEIRMHVLYLFPLAGIGLHCDYWADAYGGLLVSLICQITTAMVDQIPTIPLLTDVLVFSASSLLVILLARAVRENLFEKRTSPGVRTQ